MNEQKRSKITGKRAAFLKKVNGSKERFQRDGKTILTTQEFDVMEAVFADITNFEIVKLFKIGNIKFHSLVDSALEKLKAQPHVPMMIEGVPTFINDAIEQEIAKRVGEATSTLENNLKSVQAELNAERAKQSLGIIGKVIKVSKTRMHQREVIDLSFSADDLDEAFDFLVPQKTFNVLELSV